MRKFFLFLVVVEISFGGMKLIDGGGEEHTKDKVLKRLIKQNQQYFQQDHIRKQLKEAKNAMKNAQQRDEFLERKQRILRKAILLQRKMLNNDKFGKAMALNILLECTMKADNNSDIDRCRMEFKNSQ